MSLEKDSPIGSPAKISEQRNLRRSVLTHNNEMAENGHDNILETDNSMYK